MKKWIPNLYRHYELDELQAYLETQASQGWILEKVGLYGFWFQKGDPGSLRYCVDIPSEQRKRGGSNEYLKQYYEMCEDAGWTLVGTNMTIHVFVTDDPMVAPIHTDPQVRFETTESVLKGGMIGALAALIVMMAFILPLLPQLISMKNTGMYALFAVLVMGMIVSGKEILSYFQWKRQHEQARLTGDWPVYQKLPNLAGRVLLYVFFFAMVVGATGYVASIQFQQLQEGSRYYWLDLVAILFDSPFRYIWLALAMVIGRRYFWKRGKDDASARAVTSLILIAVMLVVMGIASEVDSWKYRKETQSTITSPVEKIKEPPITAEMLGIDSSYDAVYTQDKGSTWVSLEYIQILDGGGSLRYNYYVYGDESLAKDTWESMNRRNEYNISQEWLYFDLKWVDTDLSALGTEYATVTWYRTTDEWTEKYIYNIHRGMVWMEIEYTEGLLTDAQLQAIAEKLPQ